MDWLKMFGRKAKAPELAMPSAAELEEMSVVELIDLKQAFADQQEAIREKRRTIEAVISRKLTEGR